MAYAAYALMWIAVSSAVAVAVYITGSAYCLWALIIPALISFKTSDNDCKCEKED